MRSTRSLLFVLGIVFSCPAFVDADLIWDAGGDGVSLFQEANWQDTLTGLDPPAGSVNPSTPIGFNLNANGSATVGGSGGASGHTDLADGFSVSISDAAIWRQGGGWGFRGTSAGSLETLSISDNGQALTQFILNMNVVMSGNGELRLYGGGNPVNLSSIDFQSYDSVVTFDAEASADVISEHLGKFTVFGQSAVLDENVAIVDLGGGRSQIFAITSVPEPSSALMLGIAAVGLLPRRRNS